MNDFQTINDVVNESVRSSSYTAILISSCVFVAYTLIIKIVDYFKAKNKNKPLIDMATAIKENTANVVKLNSVLDKTLRDAERKRIKQCEATIDLTFKAFGFKLIQECSSIVAHNNIEANKQFIIDNIGKVVSTEYYKMYSTLSIYEVNEINAATKLKEEWIKATTNTIISIVYNGQDATTRITQLNNRLGILLNEYSTYVNNKLFNT